MVGCWEVEKLGGGDINAEGARPGKMIGPCRLRRETWGPAGSAILTGPGSSG